MGKIQVYLYLFQAKAHGRTQGPNLECFINRFKDHPERARNIYFNYAILARAIAKLRNYLPTYTFCSGDYYQNRLTKSKVLKLAKAAASSPPIFDESLMFRDEMIGLKEEFRNRFRNVSRLMDCVGCDKCRLWGKVQTQGYGTALKILFEFNENKGATDNPVLRRTEMVALFNTFDTVSHSLLALEGFNQMLPAREEAERNIETKERIGKIEDVTFDEVTEGEKEQPREPTLSEAIRAEWKLVWKTFFFVIKSWYYIPKYLYACNPIALQSERTGADLWPIRAIIAYSELAQKYDMLMGRPVREGLYTWADLTDPRTEL
jgi:hypothetical protein